MKWYTQNIAKWNKYQQTYVKPFNLCCSVSTVSYCDHLIYGCKARGCPYPWRRKTVGLASSSSGDRSSSSILNSSARAQDLTHNSQTTKNEKKEDRMIKDKRIYKMIKDLTQNDTDLCWATVRRLFRPRSFRFYEAVTLKKSCLSLLSDQNCSVQASNCWTGLSVISLVCHVKLKNFACRISVWSVNVCLKGLRRLRRRRLPFGECQLSFQAPQQQPGQSKD